MLLTLGYSVWGQSAQADFVPVACGLIRREIRRERLHKRGPPIGWREYALTCVLSQDI